MRPFLHVQCFYWDSAQLEYVELECDTFINISDIKEINIPRDDVFAAVRTGDTSRPLTIKKEMALEIIRVLKANNLME